MMRNNLFYLLALVILCSCGTKPAGQSIENNQTTEDTTVAVVETSSYYQSCYTEPKAFSLDADLSLSLINPDSITDDAEKYYRRGEPLGFRGKDFDRLRIYLDSVAKADNYRYQVSGRTRFMDVERSFSGEIVIDSVKAYCEVEDEYDNSIVEETGYVYAHYDFAEYDDSTAVGRYVGVSKYDYLVMNGKVCYDAWLLCADGYDNNLYKGQYINLQTNESVVCNWGDFRIPESYGLDEGSSEFVPSEDARKNHGWEDFDY